jgi:tRNA/tmRNA/rRNA uracil-C5-methylase (TrmA/RlmC/RlmD family)
VIERLARDIAPDVLIYVSCEPGALGRDLAHFFAAARRGGHEYHVQRVQPVDMFPHTPHIETVAVVRRCPGVQRRRRGTPARARAWS